MDAATRRRLADRAFWTDLLGGLCLAVILSWASSLPGAPKPPPAPAQPTSEGQARPPDPDSKLLYDQGVILYDKAKAAPAAQSEKMWKDTASLLKRSCELFPKSPWAGDAYVRQIDVALERMFDAALAAELSKEAIEWLKTVPQEAHSGGTGPAQINREASPYGLYLRAGLAAYLLNKPDEAGQYLKAAGPQQPGNTWSQTSDFSRIGVHFLLKLVQSKQALVPEDVLLSATSDVQKTALKLGSLYYQSMRFDKCIELHERVLAGELPGRKASDGVDAYAMIMLSRAMNTSDARRPEGIRLLKKLYAPKYAKYPWIADGIIRLGVFTYNVTQDPKQSMPHYKYVFTTFPNHPEAERAMYFYALDAVSLGGRALAEESCKAFLATYPKSDWRSHVQKVLSEEVPKLKVGPVAGRMGVQFMKKGRT